MAAERRPSPASLTGDDPVSLDPLDPEEALRALLAVKPNDEAEAQESDPEASGR